MSTKVRRGVHMTATARKPGKSWRDDRKDEDTALPEEEREASRDQWSAVEKEVERERQRLRGAEGPTIEERKENAVLVYDDVAGEAADEAEEEARRRRLLEESRTASPAAEPGANAAQAEASAPLQEGEYGPSLPPEGAVTAGQSSQAKNKRGGEKKTGAAKRKKREEAEDDEDEEAEGDDTSKKKRKKEDPQGKKRKEVKEDPDRWVKLKLSGDDKTKRIDATRVVHYHDFDVRHGAGAADPQAAREEPPPGNFRATLRRDLWDDDSDE